MYLSQQIAAHAVAQVLGGRNLTLALPEAQKQFSQATPQQRGAGADLSYGTLRFLGECDAYLRQLLEKPLSDEKVRALLLVAVYQLLHDKAEAFTVVNQAVKAAGFAKPRWAKSLVNGVLRNFLRQQTALSTALAQDEVAHFSYPAWWIAQLKTQYPSDWQAILQAGNQHPPMTLRVNQRKISTAEYLTLLARQGISARQVGAHAVVLQQPMAVASVPGFVEGVVSVQDAGAQYAVHFLEAQAGMRVLDACAAPGGKTGHLLELADVNVTAIDSDENRLMRVADNLKRLNLNAHLKQGDAANPDAWWDGVPYERILADVPCTASGIVRRHVDIKWLRREADIVSFTQQQSAISHTLWQLLAKGGKLLYVTCSIFKQENQQQIENFMRQHADAHLLPLPTLSETTNAQMAHGQLLPNQDHDGFFYALLQKN